MPSTAGSAAVALTGLDHVAATPAGRRCAPPISKTLPADSARLISIQLAGEGMLR